jgi:hypothetical protein
MFLLSVKMTSSSILEMQKSEWPETLYRSSKRGSKTVSSRLYFFAGLQVSQFLSTKWPLPVPEFIVVNTTKNKVADSHNKVAP